MRRALLPGAAPSAPIVGMNPVRRNYPRLKDPASEPRDKWIYEQCAAGVLYSQIIAVLKANARGWQPIASGQGVRSAAMRYAERHGLARPDPRPLGRERRRV